MMTEAEYELVLERAIGAITDAQLDHKDKWTFGQWRNFLTEVRDHCDGMIEAAIDQEALRQQ